MSEAFLRKAQESLAGASSELVNRRYNNAANRAYYACFHAAIAALDTAGVQPRGGREEWGHAFVQAEFVGLLINRRQRYPPQLRSALSTLILVRREADYRSGQVGRIQAERACTRARMFVNAVVEREQGEAR